MIKAKNYVRVKSLQEAWDLNQKKSNLVIGGMGWLKMSNVHKQTLIDLSGLGLDQIEETDGEFKIGAMCTLRQLELDQRLNRCYQDIFKACTRHIVGVQFRNCATVGGSIYGRFGFSDLLTACLVLDTYVELHYGGIVPLHKFIAMPYDNDILVRILIKKDGRQAGYLSQRQTKTDFPLIAVAAAKKEKQWYFSIGARPSKAKLLKLTEAEMQGEWIGKLVDKYNFGSNLRGSANYRQELAAVYIRRLFKELGEDK